MRHAAEAACAAAPAPGDGQLPHLQQLGSAAAPGRQVIGLALPVASRQPGERGARGRLQQRQRGQLVVRGLVAHVDQHARQAWAG